MDESPPPTPAAREAAAREATAETRRLVWGYALFAALWVGLSDLVVQWLGVPQAQAFWVNVIKGIAFVGVTSALLFRLLARKNRRIAAAYEQQGAAQRSQDRTLQLLQTLAEHSTDAIFVKDRAGRYLLFNREACRVTGKAREQVIGHDDTEVFSRDDARTIRANDEKVMAQAQPQTFEEVLDTADGRVTFLATKGPLRDADGRVVGLFGISRDVTELLASQARLRDSEAKYRMLFKRSPLPMWMLDRETLRFSAVNDALLALSGYTRQQMLSMTALDVTPDFERERLRERLGRWQRGETSGLIHGGMWTHLGQGGRLLELEIDSNDVLFEGRPVRVSMARDVSELREVERRRTEALAEATQARDHLQQVLARIDDGFVALDLEWRYTYVNQRAAELLGRVSPDDLLGRHVWTEFPEAVGQTAYRLCHEAMAAQQARLFEDHYPSWNRWFENRVYPSPDGLTIYFNEITDRKLAERVLRDRERDFRQLAEQMPAVIYRATRGPGPRPVYISPGIRILGYTPEEWMARPDRWLSIVHPEDRDRAIAERRAGIASGGEYQLEYRLRDVAGRWRHFRDLACCITPDDGSPPYVQGVAVDITEHVEAEIALRDSEARLKLSERRYRLAAVEDRVWEWDMDSGVLRASPEYWRLLKLPDPKHGDAFETLMSTMAPDDRERLREALRRHLRDREPYDLEFRALDVEGQWRWFHTIGQAVWDEQGRAITMAGTTVDISARKQAEAQLRESEAYRRSLFEQLADGVLLIDESRRIVDANPQALAMTGYRAEALPGLALAAVLSPHDREHLEEDLEAVHAGAAGLLQWEVLRRDGTRFPAEARLRSFADRRTLAVLRDVTERQATEKALLSYQLELSELTQRLLTQEKSTTQRIAQVVHDSLGQTLAVARLNLDAAIAAAPELPEALRRQCSNLSMLLDQAVRETRQMLAELRPPLLDEQGLAAALDNELRHASVAGAPPDVLLEVDDALMGQRWPGDVEYGSFMIAREAIANARRHADASLVRVLLSGDRHAMSLQVIDDGIGIPAHLEGGRPGHLGMVGMRERAIAIGARLDVHAAADGGTMVRLDWSS